MKRLLACAALAMLPGVAVASWNTISGVASLTDTSGELVLQIIDGEDAALTLISAFQTTQPAKLCENNATRITEPEFFDNWEINGTPVKMGRMCVGPYVQVLPYSREGQEYLASRVRSNKNITVKSRLAEKPFIFVNKNGSNAILKLINGPRAI